MMISLMLVDFDELLDESRFASIEKIKSIGSTYMVSVLKNFDFIFSQVYFSM
jgi:hypothetical protein